MSDQNCLEMTEPAPLSLRRATIDDLEALLVIENLSFDVYKLSRRQFRYHLNHPKNLFLVATQGFNILGMALLFRQKNRQSARLYSIAVHPNFRHDGVGLLLMKELEKWGPALNYHRITLEAKEENRKLSKFYLKLNYRLLKVIPDYYGPGRDANYFSKDF